MQKTLKGHNDTWKATLPANLQPARINRMSRWRCFDSPGSRPWAQASRAPHSGGSPARIYCKEKAQEKTHSLHSPVYVSAALQPAPQLKQTQAVLVLSPAELDSCQLICGFTCFLSHLSLLSLLLWCHLCRLLEACWCTSTENCSRAHNTRLPVLPADSQTRTTVREKDPTCFWHWCRTWCSDWRTWGWVGYSWQTPGAGRRSQTAGEEEATVWNS